MLFAHEVGGFWATMGFQPMIREYKGNSAWWTRRVMYENVKNDFIREKN